MYATFTVIKIGIGLYVIVVYTIYYYFIKEWLFNVLYVYMSLVLLGHIDFFNIFFVSDLLHMYYCLIT